MKVFFDTNILVYLFDSGSPAKQSRAREVLEQHTRAGETLLSTQVLQEFYVAVTRKLATPLSLDVALEALREFAILPVIRVDTTLILSAAKFARDRQLSFWDALVVQAAMEGGATRLYSEDMQHGQQFDGVTIHNPFR